MPDRPLIITIDGPAGAGKSTVSRLLAWHLKLDYLDTGAMYRAVAWALTARKDIPSRGRNLKTFLQDLDITIQGSGPTQKVWVLGQEIGQKIRTPEITQLASTFSMRPEVREALTEKQRAWGRRQGLVAEGRDMGTVVFPQADFKFFLTASIEIRAQRRLAELLQSGQAVSLEQVKKDMSRRDAQDQKRALAPLHPAPEARIIDTGHLCVDDILQILLTTIGGKAQAPFPLRNKS
jgi:CMP/dCMP kinase